MTTFGKILVFLNLSFALVTGGLIGLVYLTRTNWRAAYDQLNANVVAFTADAQQKLNEEAGRVEFQKREADRQKVGADAAKKEAETAKAEIERINTLLAATKKNNDGEAENVKATVAELDRRKAEVAQLALALKDRDERIRALEKNLTVVRNEAVNNKLNYESLKERYGLILGQNEEMSKEIAKIKALGIDTSATTRRPPADMVRGTVKAVDGNLATVTVGTDAGVTKENILYLFRLSPKEEYLGELTILASTPHEAVGRFKPKNQQVRLKPGDEAASRITVQK